MYDFIKKNINYLLAFTIIIVALCTVAILSLDLGTPYSKSELKNTANHMTQFNRHKLDESIYKLNEQ